eukprot:m.16912 g.16912  ORF g.16912 m.16912 type:complete len:120 (+) comp3549_c0_seq1:104-463(+)
MPPKQAKAAKPKAEEKKGPPRPTRCGPDFKWQERSKLIEAIDQNDVEKCRRLIAKGEDVDDALHHAIGRGKLQIVNLFLEAGANVHAEVKEGDYYVPPPPPPPAEKKSAKKSSKKKKKK